MKIHKVKKEHQMQKVKDINRKTQTCLVKNIPNHSRICYVQINLLEDHRVLLVQLYNQKNHFFRQNLAQL